MRFPVRTEFLRFINWPSRSWRNSRNRVLLARGDGIARSRQRDIDDFMDAAGAMREHGNPIGKIDRFVDVVGDEENAQIAARPEIEEEPLKIEPREGIKRAEWFVHQQKARVRRERPRDRHALLHPPDNCQGKWSVKSCRSTSSSRLRERSRRSRRPMPERPSNANSTLASTVRHGNSDLVYCWNT